MNLYHTTINKDDRCLDILLTEDEIVAAFQRALDPTNKSYICEENCCGCWSVKKPPECGFWKRILGMCEDCKQ